MNRLKFMGADTAVRRCLSVCAVLLICGLVSACAARPEAGYLASVPGSSAGGSEHTILVTTTRQRDARPGTLFNGERAPQADYAKVTVSIPRAHVTGEIEWASSPPGDPAANFVIRQAGYLDSEKAFIRELNAQLATRPRGSRKVFLFVHGYNTMFAEGLFRYAQVVHDSESPAVPVLFSWASHGNLTDYVYDNNSATAARDELERTIRLLFASDADQVNILAHSMGNWVTVEALRQIKMSGRLPQIAKLGRVLLAAPDIDIDVFKSQMRRFGKLKQPFYVVLSKDDNALGVSRFIAGGRSRLGDYSDAAGLTELGAVVIDLSDVEATDSSNHAKFAQIAEIGPKLRSVMEKGALTNRLSASDELDAVGGATSSVVTLPTRQAGSAIRIISGQ
ncbi:MAG: alpha/beta fold hydrolase [Methylocystis sp.]|jgi:esterase/lipase superfamily enzyme